MTRRPSSVLFAVSLLLIACSGPQTSADEDDPGPEEPTSEERTQTAISQYETFDISSYPVQPPEQTVEVAHQVPTRLLQSRADEGARQTVEGYRIQVFSAQEQESAQSFRERVRQWWQTVKSDAPSDLFREEVPIVIEYAQPYYRVRLGAFAQRDDAEEALGFVERKYSGAFVARSTVTMVQ